MSVLQYVRERPILFSGPMVRAILDGTKTQTRRVVTPQPVYYATLPDDLPRTPARVERPGWYWTARAGWGFHSQPDEAAARAMFARWIVDGAGQYGVPGDRLWVRETHAFVPVCSVSSPWPDEERAVYRADVGEGAGGRWRPSIFMPRWACRLTLDITAVRVERLQAITYDDAVAEGIAHEYPKAIADYRALWDSLNASRGYGWDTNPWVWVIEFRRCT